MPMCIWVKFIIFQSRVLPVVSKVFTPNDIHMIISNMPIKKEDKSLNWETVKNDDKANFNEKNHKIYIYWMLTCL